MDYIRVHSWCSFYGFKQMFKGTHHHCDIIQIIFTAIKILCALPTHPPPSSNCRQLLIFLQSAQFAEYPQGGIIKYIAFSHGRFSLSALHLEKMTAFQVPLCLFMAWFFFLLNNIPCLNGQQCIYPFTYWKTSGCFQVLLIINKAAINICV